MKKGEYLKYDYLEDRITEQEWKKILALDLPENLSKFLSFLHLRKNAGVLVDEIPNFARSYPSTINRWFFSLDMLYRLGEKTEEGGKPWFHCLALDEPQKLALYKVKMKKKKTNRAPKSRRPRKKLVTTEARVEVPREHYTSKWRTLEENMLFAAVNARVQLKFEEVLTWTQREFFSASMSVDHRKEAKRLVLDMMEIAFTDFHLKMTHQWGEMAEDQPKPDEAEHPQEG